MRVEEILTLNAVKFASRPLVAEGARQLAYREVDERSTRLANALSGLGLREGDRVATILPNCLELVEIAFGTARANMILVPINARLAWPEIGRILEHCRPSALIISDAPSVAEALGFGASGPHLIALDPLPSARGRHWHHYPEILASAAPARRPAHRRSDLEPWLLAYTSGTTGAPKGVILSHRSKTICSWIEALEYGTSCTDRALVNTPMFHAHALVHILSLASAGGCIVIERQFDPDRTLQVIADRGITELSMVPTMYRAILDCRTIHKGSIPPMRVARSTGAPLTSQLKLELIERLPEWRLNILYGATEAGPITSLRPELVLSKEGSVGQPFLGVRIEARDPDGEALPPGEVGEVFIESEYICSGYYGSGKPLGGDYVRWITLGDLGILDEDGCLFLHGRRTDLIISGGENISPDQVEAAIRAHPSVRDVAVIGVPHRHWGESVKAFVELVPGERLDAGELLSFCEGRISRYKLPKEIEFVAALPRNAMGKVDKRKLQAAHTNDGG